MPIADNALETEINDVTIKTLIDHFYGKVLEDEKLGPIFKRHIGASLDQWGDHLTIMYRFWSSVMNGTAQYKGNPHQVHGRFSHEAESDFFQRWLELWSLATVEIFSEEIALQFQKKAGMIAKSLHYTMFDDKLPDSYLP